MTSEKDKKVITKEEISEMHKRQFGPRDPQPCKRCDNIWTPGFWNFHGLCDDCFELFNEQKMAGRRGKNPGWYESSAAWLEDNPID